jgi:hypothetical protein
MHKASSWFCDELLSFIQIKNGRENATAVFCPDAAAAGIVS